MQMQISFFSQITCCIDVDALFSVHICYDSQMFSFFLPFGKLCLKCLAYSSKEKPVDELIFYRF